MNVFFTEQEPNQLSHIEWVALGLGLLIMFIAYIWPPILFTVVFAIFLPHVLREIGVLKDGNRRMQYAMRRAGFHAFLVLVGMFLISHGFVRQGILTEEISSATPILNESYLRSILVGAYLVSYLLQVLGPIKGSLVVLFGAAILALAPIAAFFFGGAYSDLPRIGLLLVVAVSALLVLLALLVRARPRLGGFALTGLFVIGSVAIVLLGRVSLQIESVISGILHIGLVFGCTGIVLLRARSRYAL